MTKRLSTIEEVISELGGPKAVAELTNRTSQSAVPMWKSRQRFPASTYAVMKAALRSHGADAPDSLWNNMVEAS
ncbi:carph-isopro domain-containing protein [Bradyrhizobium elkanii]|uniref:carph-isopro domain-containing protein n=1 Tax=Bradyrhizobium elkanii TaxID=29448 RepID=UPI0034E3CB60